MAAYILAQFRVENFYGYYRCRAIFSTMLKRSDGRMLVFDEAPEALGGRPNIDHVMLLEFPSEREARKFADDQENHEIIWAQIRGVSMLLKGEGPGVKLDSRPDKRARTFADLISQATKACRLQLLKAAAGFAGRLKGEP